MVTLTIKADDEHGAAMALANRLVRGEFGRVISVRGDVSNAFAKAPMAELVCTAEEVDGIFRIIGSDHGLHGAVVAIAQGQDVRPHALRV